jgi:protein-disulfide isomerase
VSLNQRYYPVLIPLAFMLGLLAGYFTWGKSPAELSNSGQANLVPTSPAAQAPVSQPEQVAAQDPQATPQVIRYNVPVDGNPVLGPEDAPITLIEFSDIECPYCRRWHLEVFPQLRAAYPDQIRYVFRDFPLTSIHPKAVPAAVAAHCANEQGMYWEFNQKLFEMTAGLSSDAYLQYAADLNLDLNSFQECFESGRYEKEVLADMEWAANLGVRSTPTFFLNGIALVGAQPFEVFKNVIDKELAGEIP